MVLLGRHFAALMIEDENTSIRAGNQRTAGRLLQGENVATAKARAALLPVLPAHAVGKHSTPFAVVDDAHE